MKIYLDILILLNFILDFIILLSVAVEKAKYPSLKRLFLATFFGSITVVFLFLPITKLTLLILKFITSIIIVKIAFKPKNFLQLKKYLKSFYGNSIILGGITYALMNQVTLVNRNYLITIIILATSTILFIFYNKGRRKEEVLQEKIYQIEITYKNKTFLNEAYLDTGNNIKDPYKKRKVIILDDDKFNIKIEEAILVPFKTVSNTCVMRCIKADKILINNKIINKDKYLIGKSLNSINILGASCIIPEEIIREDLND